ncbi:polysaccharide deacetylase family protein [Deinococcus aquiradiocola]|uniref:NodB homology domain-containing protein n=1 Tax=Deinococcus aquiradiocola TaxID=393059 RepID=A0A917UUM4_9DEIO|nr:polysaccharide deacetylase family protein [Deinococcus aquiradiocola]GGJ86570.1 hypothetical protein GCM10008939_33140 [Deinococcus aquiradiocola]
MTRTDGPAPLAVLSGTLLLALGAYIGVPYLLVQWRNLGLVRHGHGGTRTLALTFDDGPDPASTPAVLDALKAAGVHATFFVLTPAAHAHPDLTARILAEGHQLELHAVTHRHAWTRRPWRAYLDPLRGAAQLAALTGRRPRYHRPPHGAYTLATLLGQRRARLRGAHWSVEAHDWHPDFTPQDVHDRVLAQATPGAVIVMHDAGPGARNTVPALPGLLAALQAAGYALHTLDTLPGLRPLGLRGALTRHAPTATPTEGPR